MALGVMVFTSMVPTHLAIHEAIITSGFLTVGAGPLAGRTVGAVATVAFAEAVYTMTPLAGIARRSGVMAAVMRSAVGALGLTVGTHHMLRLVAALEVQGALATNWTRGGLNPLPPYSVKPVKVNPLPLFCVVLNPDVVRWVVNYLCKD